MTTQTHTGLVAAIAAAAIIGGASTAHAQFKDVLVQAPRLASPERGSVQGSLAGVGFTAAELSRGAFRLPLPIAVPSDRGPLQASVFPAYSPDGGLSEWGMGWTTDLSIHRHRLVGEVDYTVADGFMSPWGRLRPGSDGKLYPSGLSAPVRVAASGPDWIATDSAGTQYTFRASTGVTTAGGTFAWQLTDVISLVGDRTTLEWTKNASGRPFLTRVTWGGRNIAAQYELVLGYETLATAFVDHTTGTALDRRVTSVVVSARDAVTGTLAERWHYQLGYRAAPFGPAFYLETCQRVFASGETPPAMTYRYELDGTRLPTAALARYTGLDTVLQTLGDTSIQPDRAAIHDVDADGQLDFEHAAQLATIQHTETGWVQSPLPATTGDDPRCRPAPSGFNQPRVLARITGDIGAPHVLYTRRQATAPVTSQVVVCDRLGHPLADLVVPDDWQLGPNIRLADIDRDRRPDIVRISRTGIDILHNESDAQGFRFVPLPRFAWSLDATPTVSWLNDFNGDGNLDVTVRSTTGLSVMFGLGGRRFTTTPALHHFFTLTGAQLGSFTTNQVTFVDANKDGLIDVLLSKGINVWLYTNRGDVFREVDVAGFRSVQSGFGLPIAADLTGRGGTEVVFPTLGTSYVVELATPASGLLASAEDGVGTVARFRYVRSAPRAGMEQRITVLDQLTVESSGYDTVSYGYQYGPPILHTVGKQLVGFTTVDKLSPLLTERIAFLHDDDVAGVPSLSEDRDDRTPGIVRFTRSVYDDVLAKGVRWLRPSLVESGFRSAAGDVTLADTTQYTTYERDICPTVVITHSPGGQLISSTTLASVAAMPDELHCMPRRQSLLGAHSNAALDFSYLVDLERNGLGQLTHVTQFDPALHLLALQDLTYDANHRIATIGAPGRGTTVVEYDPLGRLDALTDPTGVVTQVDSVDPVSDLLLGLATVRPNASVTSFFDYDARERLQATWDDFSGSSPTLPLMSFAYQDATSTLPGRIDTKTLADAITGTSRSAVALVAADGEPLVAGTWLGDHFSLGATSIAFRTTLAHRGSFVGAVSDATLAALTSTELRALGTPLIDTVHAGFGHPIQTTTTQQTGVVGTVTTELLLSGSELVTRVHQPGGFTAESADDAAGRLVRKTDENGVIHRYSYDALGRLVRLDTPDGAHTVVFDGFGRHERVVREGIGSVTYAYSPTTGLLSRKQRLDASGAVTDASETSYDPIGRPIQVAQTAASVSSNLSFDYDGQLDTTTVAGQLGRLTRVRGDGWERRELFDPLGRPYEENTKLTAWRDVTCDKTYRADGSVAKNVVTISDAKGRATFASTKETVLDDLGRVHALHVDGAVLYTLSYDSEDRLARADFTSGEAITFDYDPVTHHRRGHRVEAPDASGGVHWDHDPRGLITAETYVHGATETRRDYEYDGRGAVTRAATASDVATYSYTASGLPDSTSDHLGARSVHRVSGTLLVGGVPYTWDVAGRLIGKGDLTFEYGANGQLAHASRPGRQIDYVYDDDNLRLLKRVDGIPVRAEVAGGVLTEDHFVELVVVGGIVAGVLDNGQFTALLTDPRGTPFAALDGTPNLASPFGVRESHLGLAEVIDYARLGWDPDLDVVRMGVRDYDPRLGQFLTPDPLYLENLEMCQGSPLQCSLYGYAGGNPISFVDPTGLGFWSWVSRHVVPRVVGAAKTAGGFVLAAGGAALCTTGAGCVLGGLGVAYGADLAATGAKEVVTGNYHRTQTNKAIASVVGQRAADNFETGVGLATTASALGRPLVQGAITRAVTRGVPPTPSTGPKPTTTAAEPVVPHGFASSEAFGQFGATLNKGLADAGYADAHALLQGSAATGRSFRTGAAFDVGRLSDFDIALGSPTLFARAQGLGVGLRSAGTRTGPLSATQVKQLGLGPLQNSLSLMAGRDVRFMIYKDAAGAAARAPSVPIP
jgi:RHS repeat-associated protein